MAKTLSDSEKMKLFQSYATLTTTFESKKKELLKSLMGDQEQITDLIVYTKEGLQAAKCLRDQGLWKEKHLLYPAKVNRNYFMRQKRKIVGFPAVNLTPIYLPLPEDEPILSDKVAELTEVQRLQQKSMELERSIIEMKNLNATLLKRLREALRVQDTLADEIGIRDAELDELTNKLKLMTDERDKFKAQVEELLTNEDELKLTFQSIEDKVSTEQHEADYLSRRVAKLEEDMHDVIGKICKENEKQAS